MVMIWASPQVHAAEDVLRDVAADEDVDAAELDDVPDDRDHADRDRDPGADRAGDVGEERPGARVDGGELRQARGRGHHPDHGDQEDQRRRRARQGDDEAGGEEEVERRRDLGDAGHDDAEQAKLAALERAVGGGCRGGGHC
jgi:hypothetical protein